LTQSSNQRLTYKRCFFEDFPERIFYQFYWDGIETTPLPIPADDFLDEANATIELLQDTPERRS
jgi:hypothetical protein